MSLTHTKARAGVVVAFACSWLLAASASAATTPLADLLVDARVEQPERVLEIDWTDLEPQASGWEHEADSGHTWALGLESVVRLDRVPDRAVLELTGRPFVHHGSRVQEVEMAIDGEVFRTLRLAPWERTYRVRIPERLLTESSNLLRLRYRWTARPDEVLASSDDSRRLAVAWSSLRLRRPGEVTPTTVEADGERVVLRGNGRVRMPLRATHPLTLTATLVEATGTAGLRLRLDATGASPTDGLWTPGSVHELVPPANASGEHVRLTLQAAQRGWWRRLMSLGRPPEVHIDGGTVIADEISWPSRDLARMGFFPEGTGDFGAKPKLVVLWVVDTLRADHLGLYGYDRDTSPRLDAFARDAVTFDRAVAQSAWTRPSVTSILTGQLLKRHGVYGKDDALAREATTLAELMHGAGYDTAAFLTNGNLRHVGLEQGFRTFRHFKESSTSTFPFHRPAPEVASAGIAWLDDEARLPALLYLHVTDPHMPYEPTPEFADLWPVDDPSVGTLDGYRATINSDEPATQDLIDLYDAEIRQADAAFGALLDSLQSRDLYDDALIIFTADHGEAFLDHGTWQHGRSLYPEQIAVPLVIHWPQGTSPHPPGSRVGIVAGHADLAPTTLAAAGVVAPTTMQGRDLSEGASRPTFAELRDSHRATVDERFKLITNPQGALLGLHDSLEDPQEHRDLTFSHPAVLEYHRRLHALFIERSAGGPGAVTAEQDEETLEQLRALGYIP